ncbi:MAG TPA: HAMP domain-containing sensor histidine kinase [Thermoleophilaceae bacterium]|nr:HAMP domain-containing sensor histidine kinase [Thermoleophilaceae bacterium]
MSILRSLRFKIAFVFFLVTAAAFTVIWFGVVPQLEQNLKERRLDNLQEEARAFRPALELPRVGGRQPAPQRQIAEQIAAAEDATDARVTVQDWQRKATKDRNPGFYPVADSEEVVPFDDALARRAALTKRTQRAYGSFHDEDIGMVAQPIKSSTRRPRIAFYSRGFEDVQATVAFVRDRVLIATAGALLIALIGGLLIATRLGRRVSRLERAARSVARGRWVEPLPVTSKDEIGQLTDTFNQMQQQLLRVDVARKEFIATASHELRTPIFSLGGFVELLQDEDLDDETRREFLETMGEQVERLQKLSVDLLDLSRLDSGSVELHTEPVDLAELTRSVAGEFHPRLAEHGTDLLLDVPDEGPSALCDRERVAQIMRILLDNALRHTPEGTDVTVSASRYNGATELTVADSGPGLPAGARAKVFERFFTGDAARGAGLGLAIARELAERMDGRLMLSGERDVTAFTLELPADGADGNGA